MRILLTGANGFTGRHLVHEILKNTDWEIVTLERLSSHTGIEQNSRVTSLYHDFRAPLQDSLLAEIGHIDYIIHNGAEVHAPRSVIEPLKFVQSNAVGTFNMLEAARKLKPRRFIYVSSSEVFGESKPGESFSEDAPLNPGTPYAATKAAGEVLCQSYFKSFRVPVNIVRPVNIFGQGQDEKKFIPGLVRKINNHETISIHVHGAKVSSRQWIHVTDYVRSLLFILKNGNVGEAYNIPGTERNNFQIVELIASELEHSAAVEFIENPTFNALQIRVSGQKLENMGWTRPENFEFTVSQIVREVKA